MDTDKLLENGFCWPAQDRDRACPPSSAPRTPPVFAASVSLKKSLARIPNPLAAPSPAVHRLSWRFAPSIPGQFGGLRTEGISCPDGRRSAGQLRCSGLCRSANGRIGTLVIERIAQKSFETGLPQLSLPGVSWEIKISRWRMGIRVGTLFCRTEAEAGVQIPHAA